MAKKEKLKTPEWILGGYDSEEDYNKAKGITSKKKKGKKKNWIQGAINPKHKGYCTPMSKPTCTPRRKALAKRFKKGGDLHKKKGRTKAK